MKRSAAIPGKVGASGHPGEAPGYAPPWSLRGAIACEDDVEDAILFLTKTLAGRRTKKAVVLHSLRAGFYLMGLGCSDDVVIAALLHDVLEKKPDLTAAQLSRRFGARVGRLVAAVTNEARIHDALARYEDSVRRCADVGPDALVVRAADLIDNTDRLLATQAGEARLLRASEKLRLVTKACRDGGADERVIADLSRRTRQIGRRLAAVTLYPRPLKTQSRAG